MATRVVSGIALFVIIGISVLLGALPFGIILMAFSIIAAFELSRVVGIHGKGYSGSNAGHQRNSYRGISFQKMSGQASGGIHVEDQP